MPQTRRLKGYLEVVMYIDGTATRQLYWKDPSGKAKQPKLNYAPKPWTNLGGAHSANARQLVPQAGNRVCLVGNPSANRRLAFKFLQAASVTNRLTRVVVPGFSCQVSLVGISKGVGGPQKRLET